MKSRSLILWLAILFVFSGSMLFLMATGRFRNAREAGHHVVAQQVAAGVQPVEASGEPMHFVLTDQNEQNFESKSLDGKIWVGSVFFSTCPSTCRAQNLQVAELQRKYGDQGVEFVSITCDPEKDTPQALKDYSSLFNADPEKWHFLTGDYDLIEKIGNQKFGITVQPQVHSDRLVLFDREGQAVGAYRSTNVNQFQELMEKLDEILAEDPVTNE